MPSTPPRLASGCPDLKFAKGPTRAELKGSSNYRERQIIKVNRAHCERRDGDCRIGYWGDIAIALFGECMSAPEWNHFRRRSKSRGEPPEQRHSTEVTGMLCGRHHDMVDEHEIDFVYLTSQRADGQMKFWNAIGELVEHEMPKPRHR
jgi:hypothetical protein